jgi:hypothetical protein
MVMSLRSKWAAGVGGASRTSFILVLVSSCARRHKTGVGRFAYITKKQTYRVNPNHPDELWKDWPPPLRY